jgi:hypothetical protein
MSFDFKMSNLRKGIYAGLAAIYLTGAAMAVKGDLEGDDYFKQGKTTQAIQSERKGELGYYAAAAGLAGIILSTGCFMISDLRKKLRKS